LPEKGPHSATKKGNYANGAQKKRSFAAFEATQKITTESIEKGETLRSLKRGNQLKRHLGMKKESKRGAKEKTTTTRPKAKREKKKKSSAAQSHDSVPRKKRAEELTRERKSRASITRKQQKSSI